MAGERQQNTAILYRKHRRVLFHKQQQDDNY